MCESITHTQTPWGRGLAQFYLPRPLLQAAFLDSLGVALGPLGPYSYPHSQAPARAPGRKGAKCPVRLPPLGEALTLWGFPAFSINNPPSLPTNSSPFLEKRDCGQGFHAAVCQPQGKRPAAGELPRGAAPPSPRRHGSSWELGTLPLFFKTGSRFITQPGLDRVLR